MVERYAGADQFAHHIDMTQVRCRDQRGALPATRDVARSTANRQRNSQCRDIVGDRGNGDDVVLVRFQRVGVRSGQDERTHDVMLAGEGGDVQWRATVGVSGAEIFAAGGQSLDRARVPRRCSGERSRIGAQFRTTWRNLGLHPRATEPEGQRQHAVPEPLQHGS